MKKILLSLIFAVALVFANAQCTPDPQFTVPGIYPDSATGISSAYVGQSYSEVITVITPLDTSIVYQGNLIDVTISTIKLASLTGLPQNFTYACDPPNCSFPGGSTGCISIYSTTPPLSSDIGSYDIIFETTSYASNVPFLGTFTQDDVIDYYYIEISAATSTMNQFDDATFELKGIYPNPVINQASIQFLLGFSENITLKIYNLLGEEIESQVLFSSRGINNINFDFSMYSEGIYLYTLSNGVRVLTDRIVVKN